MGAANWSAIVRFCNTGCIYRCPVRTLSCDTVRTCLTLTKRLPPSPPRAPSPETKLGKSGGSRTPAWACPWAAPMAPHKPKPTEPGSTSASPSESTRSGYPKCISSPASARRRYSSWQATPRERSGSGWAQRRSYYRSTQRKKSPRKSPPSIKSLGAGF